MLKGMVSLVTGGASGLGKGTAEHVIKHGASVVICDLDKSDGPQIADKLGDRALFSPCDITSEADVRTALSLCEHKFGPLDFVVNCAARSRAFKIMNKKSGRVFNQDDMSTVMETNLYGAFNVFRLASEAMWEKAPDANQQRGVIIQAGCSAAYDGILGQSVFSASKAAASAMILPIAREMASHGIRAVTISPSVADTPFNQVPCIPKELIEFFENQMLASYRFISPEEFAGLVSDVVLQPMINGTDVKLTSGVRLFSSHG